MTSSSAGKGSECITRASRRVILSMMACHAIFRAVECQTDAVNLIKRETFSLFVLASHDHAWNWHAGANTKARRLVKLVIFLFRSTTSCTFFFTGEQTHFFQSNASLINFVSYESNYQKNQPFL